MAVLASVRCLHMRWAFPGCAAAVMATNAITNNTSMIELSGQPAGRGVTVVALIT